MCDFIKFVSFRNSSKLAFLIIGEVAGCTKQIEFSYVNDRGTVFKRRHVFEGVIPNMDRRYRETESSSVRDELAKYVSTAACKTCEGTRLCEDARSVFVDGRTLPSITSMPVGDAEAYFNALELTGRQGEIADKILKELRARYRARSSTNYYE